MAGGVSHFAFAITQPSCEAVSVSSVKEKPCLCRQSRTVARIVSKGA